MGWGGGGLASLKLLTQYRAMHLISLFVRLKPEFTSVCLIIFSSKAVLAELKEKGVAVVPNVLTHAQCDEYIDQYKTWFNQFDEAGVEMESRKSLIQAYRIGHFDTTWQVRLKAKPVFAKLWDTEKLLTSADAVAIGKPPEEG